MNATGKKEEGMAEDVFQTVFLTEIKVQNIYIYIHDIHYPYNLIMNFKII